MCVSQNFSSQECQETHWKSGHKAKCKTLHDTSAINSGQNEVTKRGSKASPAGGKSSPSIALIPSSGSGTSKPIKQPKDVIFFYGSIQKFALLFLPQVVKGKRHP